ncbi:MAG: carbohydrate ABC transporter permease [Dongiaceae bacterium]
MTGLRRRPALRGINDPAPAWAVLSYAVLGFWAFVVLFPLYWLAVTSLKLPIDVNDGPDYVPWVDFVPSLHAWRYIFVDLFVDTARPYLNTVVVGLASSAIALGIGSMAAYGLARLSYRPRLGTIFMFILGVGAAIVAIVILGVPWKVGAAAGGALFILLALSLRRFFTRTLKNEDIAFWMISQRILPPVTVVVPIFVLFQQVGLLDTRTALIVTYVAVNVPIVVWLMRDFFESIPLELEEAALVDGCSRYRIFWSIVLPLSKPGLVATFILVLIMAWNEYLFALFLSSANAQTLPLTVAAQNATRGPQWWYMSVLIIIMILPVSLLAVLLARYITRGLLIGAVKG